MSMKVVDELMTPGCPQCAIKHLSAALFHHARYRIFPFKPRPGMEYVAIACINLYEVFVGYRSHLWYAVGALVTAEEQVERGKAPDATIREIRLTLEKEGLAAVPKALEQIAHGMGFVPAEWELAHFYEARRELPAMADQMRMDDLIGSIERIREAFFNLPPSTVPGGEETTQTEKEPDMATAKKTAPKGAKCAAKGGKTATNACGKGGKAKK